ncbi:MAG: beta-galactosidase [Weeksellaceae bacterium]|nr:beta-galactosidase [Weeksellaceae bacterium]
MKNRLAVFLIRTLILLLPFTHANAGEIPVMAFHGVQKEFISEQHFRRLKGAGINISFSIYITNEEVAQALDCAQLSGVKLLIYSYDLINNTAATVQRFKNHPALFGYFIIDEPDTSVFSELKRRIEEIRKYDPKHPVYVNLYPNYAQNTQMKSSSYVDYLSKYVNTVPVDFISFDNYPLMNGTVHPGWYGNLELIRNVSILSNKNFWAFANSTIFGPYKQPTMSGLKLQMYSNLLYGAQGLQYFTYWTLDDENWKKNRFSYAIVDAKGRPTVTYEIVKKTNADIQKYAHVFLGSKVESVHHTSFRQPSSTKKLSGNPAGFNYFRSDGPALISLITNGAKKYIVVLNKDLSRSRAVSVEGQRGLKYMDSNGLELSLGGSRKSFVIAPGDILVFRY